MMSDTSSLRSEMNSKSAQKSRKESEKANIDRKLERLRTARDQVAAEKSNINELRNSVRAKDDPGDSWKGQKRNQYCDYVSNDFKGYYDTYYNHADTLHDDITRKIVELENESSELGGIIGWLASSINSLWGEIQSAFN